ncbi:MAG: hypothetical protein FJX72_11820 [Armatimonadetes bacterium]|nr:hypothetical protein [Armatimonadota bacterium]
METKEAVKPTFWASFRKAQAEMKDPVKDSSNPHFKSRFVSLKGVLEAVRPALHKHGLCIVQTIEGANVTTTIYGDDGEAFSSTCPIICAKQNDPQAFGSALTYARRYAAAAICGLAPADEDDDAEAAVERSKPPAKPATTKAPAAAPFDLVEEAVAAIQGAADSVALGRVTDRIKASKFVGEDAEQARIAYRAKFTELNQPKQEN